MMKKHFLSLFLVVVMLGCDSGGDTPLPEGQTYKGERGVTIEIIPESLPSQVYEWEEFPMVMKVTNLGAASIGAGDSVLKLSLEKDYVEFVGGGHIATENFELEGKENFINLNDFVIKEYRVRTLELDEESQRQTVSIQATACYRYKTSAYVDVCIDTDVYNTRPIDKVCSAKTTSLSGGQGGPVSVTRVETSMLTDGDSVRPQFKIYIKNTDTGSVIDQGSVETVCSSSPIDLQSYNMVELTGLQFSDYRLSDFECQPNRGGRFYAKLEHEEDSIICTLRSGAISRTSSSYLTPLYIEFSYGYTLTQTRNLIVVKIS